MRNLEKAISGLLDDTELVTALATILAHASETGRISYNEVAKIAGNNLEEVLLLGNKWRLLLPTRVEKSGAWEDRLLLCKPGESYELANIIRYMVEEASKTGCWDSEHAVTNIFKEMGEPAWQRMPKLIERLEEQAENHRIAATKIKKIFSESGLGDRVDALIAELKAAGVMSPKLGSLAEVARAAL